MLPHRFPFSLVEVLAGDRVVLSVSAGSWWTREGSLPPMMALEALAQGAAILLRETGEGPKGPAEALYLAGIDSAAFSEELESSPLRAGDVLEIRARLRLRLGPLLRIEAEMLRDDRRVVEAAFTASAPPDPPEARGSALAPAS